MTRPGRQRPDRGAHLDRRFALTAGVRVGNHAQHEGRVLRVWNERLVARPRVDAAVARVGEHADDGPLDLRARAGVRGHEDPLADHLAIRAGDARRVTG